MQLSNYGCAIESDIALIKEHIRLDLSDNAKAFVTIREIFIDEIYNLSCEGDLVVIDIGMNRAIASLFFSAKENVRKIYAFEPFKPTVALAKKNLDLNPELSKKIQVFTYGLGKKNVILEVPYSPEESDRARSIFAVSAKRNSWTETVTVKDAAEVLAPIFEEHKSTRIVIKCDCEGAEFDIFERLDEAKLIGNIDIILMEYHFEKPDRLVKILTEAGFAVNVQKSKKNKHIFGYLYAVKTQNRQNDPQQ